MGCGRKIGPFDCCSVVCGDCIELMKQLPDGCVDAVISDPPYGISFTGPRTRRETIIGDDSPFDPTPLLSIAPSIILWGANNYAKRLPDSENWLVWQKRGENCATKDHGDCELAWTWNVVKGGVKSKRFIWDGNIRETDYEMERLHPTQKPVTIMQWCISLIPDATMILDPYAGSGTTGVAAKLGGRHFLLFELDQRHAETARKRIAAVEAQPSLFEAKPEQLTLGAE